MFSWKKIVLTFIVLIFLILASFILWYSNDIKKVDDSLYLPEKPTKIQAQDNSFYDLEQLRKEFDAVHLKGGLKLSDALQESQYDQLIIEADFTQDLPQKLALILKEKIFQEKEINSYMDNLPHLTYYRSFAKLMKILAIHQWESGDKSSAIKNLYLIDKLATTLGSQSKTIISLLVASAIHSIADQAKLHIINTGSASYSELVAFQTIMPRDYLQRQMKVALQSEYKLLFNHLNNEIKGIKSLGYCENRTKAFWINLMTPLFKALDKEKLYVKKNLTNEFDAKIRKYKADVFHSRNTLGRIYIAMLVPALSKMLSKIKETQIRNDLIPIRASLEMYRQKHGNLPKSLDELKSEFVLPKDPWSNYQDNYCYDLKNLKLYSIGHNYIDDKGDFTRYSSDENNTSFKYGAKDYGLIFKNPSSVKP